MAEIWTPAQAKTLPRIAPPEADVWLTDDRVLRVIDRISLDVGGGAMQHQIQYATARRPRLSVIASMDPTPHGELLHVSLSYPDHLPSWKDVRLVRNAFYGPAVDVMMILPREQDYVNVHPYCFHLQQTPVGWGLR